MAFPVNQLFESGNQVIVASALASVLPMNIQILCQSVFKMSGLCIPWSEWEQGRAEEDKGLAVNRGD